MVDATNYDHSKQTTTHNLKKKVHNHFWGQIFKHKLNETSLKPLIKP